MAEEAFGGVFFAFCWACFFFGGDFFEGGIVFTVFDVLSVLALLFFCAGAFFAAGFAGLTAFLAGALFTGFF